MSWIGQFLRELKRRKVYQVAIAYAVASVAVWEVAGFAFPALGLPETAQTFVLVLTILGFPLALVLAWAYEVRPEGEERVAGAESVQPAVGGVRSAPVRERSIAVLPFDNMSPEPDSEYFADGVSEELTHALARVEDLWVAARTSAFVFRGEHRDVREIGRELGVSHVVEGSVRRSGNRIRVTAQLVDTADGYHCWGERFERELGDVFTIQDEIVEGVVTALVSRLGASAEVPELPRTPHAAAYDAYLRARHLVRQFGPESVRSAEASAEEAIATDPAFAPAHALLVEILTLEAIGFSMRPPAVLMPRARRAAERALELAPNLPESHMAMGLVLLFYDWNFRDARRELEKAVELAPSLAEAHFWCEFYWTYVERDEKRALASNARALELSPLDAPLRERKGTILYIFGHYDEALEVYRALWNDGSAPELTCLGMADALSRMDRLDEAIGWVRRLLRQGGRSAAVLGVSAGILARAGHEEEARTLLEDLLSRDASGFVSHLWPGLVHASLGEMDEAFEELERGVEERDSSLLYLAATPSWYGVREDPRFEEVLGRMGLAHVARAVKNEMRSG